MNIKYRKDELDKAIKDFYNITKICIAVLDPEFQCISRLPFPDDYCGYIQRHGCADQCAQSDCELLRRCAETRCTQVHTCHAGLLDFALPILYKENIIGYVIMGRIRSDWDFERIYDPVSQSGISKHTLRKYYDELICYDETQIESAANLALMLITYILSRDMVRLEQDFFAQRVQEYIAGNLQGDLTVERLCDVMNVSKNILYKRFRESFNCRVNEYVTARRIDEAKQLLMRSEEPIHSICEYAGIQNYSYFCKLFKKHTGLTPLQYRREMR